MNRPDDRGPVVEKPTAVKIEELQETCFVTRKRERVSLFGVSSKDLNQLCTLEPIAACSARRQPDLARLVQMIGPQGVVD